MVVRDYGMDEFVDEFCDGMKPSAAIRAYNSCKETYDWMRDGLYLSNGDIASLSEVISENEDEVNTLVEKAASERAARYAYDHPKLPEGFVTITQLQGDLDLGDLRDEVEDFDFDGDITEAFGETAEYKVDDNYHALLTWLPDHTEWLEQAEFDGLLEGCKGDIYKMVQMAQYECFKSDLYDHREDICRYGTLDQLRDMGVYAIRESLADEILNDLYNSPELCAAPRYVEQSFGCPSEEYEKEEGTLPHDFTTGKWRVHLVYPGEPRADGIPRGSKKGNPPCADTMVEFYDTEDNGQFVASFHMNTLLGYPWNGMVGADLDGLEAYGFAYPLSTQAATDWLEGDDLAKVNVFLKETCKEAFGILPGVDDGGYSLSGEAKEAALSRFALPENRKAALDVIRKLNESRDSNDNAL